MQRYSGLWWCVTHERGHAAQASSPPASAEDAEGTQEPLEHLAAGSVDCTHLSPDALLFISQALAGALADDDDSGQGSQRR